MFASPRATSVPDLTSGAALSFKCNVPAGGREGLSMGTSGPKVTDTDQDRLTDRARRASHIFLRAARSPHLVCLNLGYLLFYVADWWQDRRWRIKSGVGFRGYRSVAQLEVVGDPRSASPYVPTSRQKWEISP